MPNTKHRILNAEQAATFTNLERQRYPAFIVPPAYAETSGPWQFMTAQGFVLANPHQFAIAIIETRQGVLRLDTRTGETYLFTNGHGVDLPGNQKQ